jgi:hypothetical protein
VKLTKCQNEHHHSGVFDTWTKGAKPQAKWAQGSAGRPGFGSTQLGTWLTRLYIGSQGRIEGLKAVEAERSIRPTVHLLQTDLAKSVEIPLCSYISPLRLKTQ